MAQRLDHEKTAANIDIFAKLVISYKTAVDGLFDYVMPLIKAQSQAEIDRNASYFIANNGTTNMISPMITIMEDYVTGKNTERVKYIPAILRALFSFEIYQVTRKFNKSDDDKVTQRKQILDNLLGIDLVKYATPLPPMFEEHDDKKHGKLTHHREMHVNENMLDDLIKRFFWVDYVVNLPSFILNSFRGAAGKKAILDTPAITPEKICEIMELKCDLKTFKLFCIVQSFLFDSKAERVDNDIHQMLTQDEGNVENMRKMIAEYIEKQYRGDYQSRLNEQHKLERSLLANELVTKMCECEEEKEFLELFRNGLIRNHVSVVISDTYQLGFALLKDMLFDPKANVKLRKLKMTVLVLGVDRNNNTVWNKGNALRAVPVVAMKKAFDDNGLGSFWEQKLYPVFKSKNKYMYRDSDTPNRHSHCNSKAPFWAFGYKTVGAYFKDITEEERQEYMKIHTNCCGIWDGKLVKPA